MKTVVMGLNSFILLANCASILCCLPIVSGGEVILLEDKHKKAGVVCEECHKGGAPKSDVMTDTCFKCHISYSKVAEQTNKITPNPHKSHRGDLECMVCHHIHRTSEDYCKECHNIGFKVP